MIISYHELKHNFMVDLQELDDVVCKSLNIYVCPLFCRFSDKFVANSTYFWFSERVT